MSKPAPEETTIALRTAAERACLRAAAQCAKDAGKPDMAPAQCEQNARAALALAEAANVLAAR